MSPGLQPQRFRLAPMDGMNLLSTVVMLALPGLFVLPSIVAALSGAERHTTLVLVAFGAVSVPIILLYVGIWLYGRPTYFELSPEGLRIVWPARQALVPLSSWQSVELVDGATFRRRYGTGMRVGAGGLFGGFGRLETQRGTFRLYVSRLDQALLLHVSGGPAWRLTPATPQRFYEAALALIEAHGTRPAARA